MSLFFADKMGLGTLELGNGSFPTIGMMTGWNEWIGLGLTWATLPVLSWQGNFACVEGEGGLPYDFMISERAHTYDGALKARIVHIVYLGRGEHAMRWDYSNIVFSIQSEQSISDIN